MAPTLRDLVYLNEYDEELKNKMLFIIDSPDWIEQIFRLIKEQSDYIYELTR